VGTVSSADKPAPNQASKRRGVHRRIRRLKLQVRYFSGSCPPENPDAPKNKIELHHHDVDGREGSELMDWGCTRAYCRAFAKAFDLKLFFSWKKGGFEREMLRTNELTAPILWEREDGSIMETGGEKGKPSTRRKFPQVTADLSRRYCSPYLKIDVGSRILTTEERFRQGKTLVVTGERAQESASRARYQTFEPDRADNRDGARVKRWIDHWRPVHGWLEEEIWAIMRRHRVNPHPAYHLGWGRTSCLACIFGSANQWASIRKIAPAKFERIAQYEEEFGITIHRTLSVRQLADKGTPYEMDAAMIELAMGDEYPVELMIVPEGQWQYPAGAFGESNGPV
jgi:3'-phosphoadenosine 5'-phosphosulfate sulfotransferase (PAPS reductase)/FAD synthetase